MLVKVVADRSADPNPRPEATTTIGALATADHSRTADRAAPAIQCPKYGRQRCARWHGRPRCVRRDAGRRGARSSPDRAQGRGRRPRDAAIERNLAAADDAARGSDQRRFQWRSRRPRQQASRVPRRCCSKTSGRRLCCSNAAGYSASVDSRRGGASASRPTVATGDVTYGAS